MQKVFKNISRFYSSKAFNPSHVHLIIITILFLGLSTVAALLFLSPVQLLQAQCTNASSSIKLYGDSFLSSTTGASTFDITDSDISQFICGEKAKIPQFSLGNYKYYKGLYYTQFQPTTTDIKVAPIAESPSFHSSIELPVPPSPNKLYNFTGDLEINGEIDATKRTGVIFVDKDLYINSNLTQTSNSSGLVFWVGGNVWIDESVTEINALIFVHGTFCSAYYNPGTPNCRPNPYITVNQLVINGSVIYLSDTTSNTPQFVRSVGDNEEPAEVINYQPKYLVILKNFFGKTRMIWSEET